MISLLELFRPPRGMKGTHLMVCGLSAEPSVLNAALEIFTEEVSLAHRLTGRLVGLLMLDASQPLFAPEDVPGVMQIPPPRALTWADRTSLLHAKVALLGFSRIPHGSPERFRLIVSTGNWTTRSFGVGGDIDMVWRCDASPNVKNESYRDCVAAFLFFQRLLEELYEFPIRECPDAARDFLNVWRNLLTESKGRRRFIHSLDRPLWGQISARFEEVEYGTVVCGSGFFEQPQTNRHNPFVFEKIDSDIARGKARRVVVVNKAQPGGLAGWLGSPGCKWEPRAPRDPIPAQQRAMVHAKYIAAVRGGNKQAAKIELIYLGSGNLSIRGLFSCVKIRGGLVSEVGNIEAGAVFCPTGQPEDAFKSLLVGKEYMARELRAFGEGESEPLHQPVDGPPVRWFLQNELRLIPNWSGGETHAEVQAGGSWISIDQNKKSTSGITVDDSVPARIRVRRESDSPEYLVPVFRSDGSFCRSKPHLLTADGVLQSIGEFPSVSVVDDDDESEPDAAEASVGSRFGLNATDGKTKIQYPVRWLAALIESIARQHDELEPVQYPAWFSHLRLVLCEQIGDLERKTIQELGLGQPFLTLLRSEFRPAHLDRASDSTYEKLIRDIQRYWDRENCTY